LTSFPGQQNPEERKADGFTEFTLSFAEILDASTAVTKNFDFELFPDKDVIQTVLLTVLLPNPQSKI
jgi:hypothetical protein